MSTAPIQVLLVPVEHDTHDDEFSVCAVGVCRDARAVAARWNTTEPAATDECPMTGTSNCPTDMDQTEGCTRC